MSAPKAEIAFTETDCFVIFDGLRIAKRHAKTWIPLEPGYVVRDCKNGELEVEYKNQTAKVQ